LRAKTVKQSTTLAVPAAANKTSSASASSSVSSSEAEMAEPQDKENVVTVFPVKSSLRSAALVDKENVAPSALKQSIATAVADWDDLDAEDTGDILMVSDYVVDIFDYMRSSEVSCI
jgi:hypothetical protein